MINTWGRKSLIQLKRNTIRRVSTLFILSVFCIGCAQEEEFRIITLEPTKAIEQLSDSTYLTVVTALESFGDRIYVGDNKSQKLLLLDSSLKLINTIGRGGRGPGEFISPYYMQIDRDTLYALSARGAVELHLFDMAGRYSRTIKTPERIMDKYTVVDGRIIYSSRDFVNAITVLSPSGNVEAHIGKIKGAEADEDRRIILSSNQKHILSDSRGNIIAVYATAPIIEKYDQSGVLLESLDLSSIKLMNSLWENYASALEGINEKVRAMQVNAGGMMYYLFQDAAIMNDRLYLRINGWPRDGRLGEILVVDVSGGKMAPIHLLNPIRETEDEKIGTTALTVTRDGRLVLYDIYYGKLFEYKLPPWNSN